MSQTAEQSASASVPQGTTTPKTSPQKPAATAKHGFFANLNFKTKFTVAIGTLLALMLAIGGYSLYAVDRLGDEAEHLLAVNGFAHDLAAMDSTLISTRSDVLLILGLPDQENKQKYHEEFQKKLQVVEADKQALSASPIASQVGGLQEYFAVIDEWMRVLEDQLISAAKVDDRELYAQRLHEDMYQNARTAYYESYDSLTAKIDALEEKAHTDVMNTRTMAMWTIVAILAGAIILGLLLGTALFQSIRRPLVQIRSSILAMGKGDLRARTTYRARDELGQMCGQYDESLIEISGLLGHSATLIGGVSDTAGRLASGANTASDSAAEVRSESEVVSGAADEVSQAIGTVAAGVEEMGASIREIATNANDAARVATEATAVAHETSEVVGKLGESSREIGEVIREITAIAEQTNLLALNATIEAARAGEAGKGFAVVAGEVKELAAQTGKATENIEKRITHIQNDTEAAVEAIERISSIISRINDYQTTIAAAVEEQTATTNEMSRSATDAATSANQIAANINQVATGADETATVLQDMLHQSNELAAQASRLREEISRFNF